MRPTAIVIFTVVSSLFAIQANASAQMAGHVSGEVKDKSGSVLPGVMEISLRKWIQSSRLEESVRAVTLCEGGTRLSIPIRDYRRP